MPNAINSRLHACVQILITKACTFSFLESSILIPDTNVGHEPKTISISVKP